MTIIPSGKQASDWGLEDVKLRKDSQQSELLYAYVSYGPMISEEAANSTNIGDCEHWVRCGELRKKKLLEWVTDEDGNQVYKTSSKGSRAGVMKATPLGRRWIRANS